MSIYYMATHPDGTDFHHLSVKWSLNVPQVLNDPPDGEDGGKRRFLAYDSIGEVLGNGGQYPCRVFKAEGTSEIDFGNHAFGFTSLVLTEEYASWTAYGENGQAVKAFLAEAEYSRLVDLLQGVDDDLSSQLIAEMDREEEILDAVEQARQIVKSSARIGAWDAIRNGVSARAIRPYLVEGIPQFFYGRWASVGTSVNCWVGAGLKDYGVAVLENLTHQAALAHLVGDKLQPHHFEVLVSKWNLLTRAGITGQ